MLAAFRSIKVAAKSRTYIYENLRPAKSGNAVIFLNMRFRILGCVRVHLGDRVFGPFWMRLGSLGLIWDARR